MRVYRNQYGRRATDAHVPLEQTSSTLVPSNGKNPLLDALPAVDLALTDQAWAVRRLRTDIARKSGTFCGREAPRSTGEAGEK
jgi:hypothetical protein